LETVLLYKAAFDLRGYTVFISIWCAGRSKILWWTPWGWGLLGRNTLE